MVLQIVARTLVECYFLHMRTYGTGSLWLRKSKKHPKGLWWIRYYSADRQRAEKTKFCECHTRDAEEKAKTALGHRVTQAQEGTLPPTRTNKTLVSDLTDRLFQTMRTDKMQKIPEALPASTRTWRLEQAERVITEQQARWDKHLAPVFGDRKASLVTEDDIKKYRAARLDAGARHATINLEMALLKRAYRLGFMKKPRLVLDMPSFPAKLAVSPRKGFIEDATYNKLRDAINAIEEPGLRALIVLAYRLGFRRSELVNLLVMQLDNGWLRLFAGATKNSKPRNVKLPEDIRALLEECAKGKEPEAYLLTRASGKRIKDFRGAWEKATAAAGVPDLLFHDLRRSTVRRLRKRGIPTATAMKITGHLTRTVFDDYDQANDPDVADAADKI